MLKQVDRYIYGHPYHRVFKSIEQFFPHYCYLSLHKDGDVCRCSLCETGEKLVSGKGPIAMSRSARRRKLKENSRVSLPSLSTLLRQEGNLDWSIEERQNIVRGVNKGVTEQDY